MNDRMIRITNNFIDWGNQNGVSMSPLKLQKLVYLYYARYYHLQGKLPFGEDRFEKWPKGPVLRELYELLKLFRTEKITEPLTDVRGKVIAFDVTGSTLFQEVVQRYGRMTGNELVQLTHEGLPGVGAKTAWEKTPDMGGFLRFDDISEDGRNLFA